MFNILEYIEESFKQFGRDLEQSVHRMCKEYADGGNREKCYTCSYKTCYRHIEALRLIKEPEDNKVSEKKAVYGSSQQQRGGKTMKIYIAGAITNNPNYKEQFKAAYDKLKAEGHEVINPAENQGYTYREYINAGLFQLMSCDAIYLLKGYEKSTGATLEHDYAMTVGIKVIKEDEEETTARGLYELLSVAKNVGANVDLQNKYIDIILPLLEAKAALEKWDGFNIAVGYDE